MILQNGAIVKRSILALVAALMPLLAHAEFLTPKQKAEAASVGQMIEQQCLVGAAPPANATPSVKMMMEWSKDPQICSCVGASVRDSMTLKVFLMKEAEAKQWLVDTVAVSSMKCSAPVARKKFTEQCEALFTADASIPGARQPDANSLRSTCDCARDVLSKTTDKELVDVAVRGYTEYLERKRSGNQQVQRPRTPIESALDQCMAGK